MTTLGFHYYPDDVHYRQPDLQTWLPELLALDAKWLTLIGTLSRAVPEPFIKGLLDAGIEPIIHIPALPTRPATHPTTVAALRSLFETYARWGVKYVVPFAEPNTRGGWAPADWGQAGLVDRFADLLLPVAKAQVEAGLAPTIPPLHPGGDYWDTAFLEALLSVLNQRGQAELARQMVFGVYLWAHNRPANWGGGGLKRWPQARPYLTPPGSQDQRGFRLFEWYDEIIRARLGEARPILCLAGGPALGDATDPAYPVVDEARHASCIQDITRAASAGELPRNLLNVNFWLLAAPESSPYAEQAWYRPSGTTLQAVETLKRLAGGGLRPERRRNGEGKGLEAAQARAADDKSLAHYLLLPVFEWGVSEWHWSSALEYVRTHRPTCGFSPDEAAQAQRVTIYGNEQGVSIEIEEGLRRAGCEVERIPASQGAG